MVSVSATGNGSERMKIASVGVFNGSGVCCRLAVYPSGVIQVSHAHESAIVSVVLAGRARETSPRRAEAQIGFLALGVKPAGWQHANAYGPEGAAILSLSLPAGPEADEVNAASEPGWRAGGPALREFVAAAVRGELDEARIVDVIAEALASDVVRVRTAQPPNWLLRVREEIGESDAFVGDVARTHGVHRVYLARQFKKWFGCSLTAYRQRLRAARAVSASTLERAPLGQAAAAAGYADQSHMTRAIGAALGVTPGQLRNFVGLAGPT